MNLQRMFIKTMMTVKLFFIVFFASFSSCLSESQKKREALCSMSARRFFIVYSHWAANSHHSPGSDVTL